MLTVADRVVLKTKTKRIQLVCLSFSFTISEFLILINSVSITETKYNGDFQYSQQSKQIIFNIVWLVDKSIDYLAFLLSRVSLKYYFNKV